MTSESSALTQARLGHIQLIAFQREQKIVSNYYQEYNAPANMAVLARTLALSSSKVKGHQASLLTSD